MIGMSLVRTLSVRALSLGTQAPDGFVFYIHLGQPIDVVWNTEVVIEPQGARSGVQWLGRKILHSIQSRVTEMPFSDLGGLVPMLLQIRRQRQQFRLDQQRTLRWTQHTVFQTPSPSVPTCEQRVASGSANGTGCVCVEELHAFLGKAIDVRSTNVPDIRAVAVRAAVTQVIGKNHDNVGRALRRTGTQGGQ